MIFHKGALLNSSLRFFIALKGETWANFQLYTEKQTNKRGGKELTVLTYYEEKMGPTVVPALLDSPNLACILMQKKRTTKETGFYLA